MADILTPPPFKHMTADMNMCTYMLGMWLGTYVGEYLTVVASIPAGVRHDCCQYSWSGWVVGDCD